MLKSLELPELGKLIAGVKLSILTYKQKVELQTALRRLALYTGTIDGQLGPKSLAAWQTFKAENNQGQPELIGPGSISILSEKCSVKKYSFSKPEIAIKSIIAECKRYNFSNKQTSYILATVKHETSSTFQPVRESYWNSEAWRKKNLRYWPYYGRGFPQLTWPGNYKRYSEITGVDLYNDPDKALDPEISLFILMHGSKSGAFTGAKISDYINVSKTDFINARRVVNGTDQAEKIARIAQSFLEQLKG